MDRRAAGALLALAACIASAAAAPTAGNQTALEPYNGASEGCYYNFQHYGEGDRIMTNEPCLNCTCHNRMLMCYLRVCPFTKPIGQDCSVEKRADQCCPIVTCPDVPVDLLTSTSTTSPAEYGETGVGRLDRYGCSINGKYFSEGSKVPSTPNKPCEHCYCIRNMTTCVMQECTLHVDGCTPIYHKDVCCPVRYSCDHPEDEIPLLDDMTTTVRPTPGFLLTTTTLSPVTQMTQDCVHNDQIFADGALIKTEKACQHCYCMKGDIVCVVQECGTPMENEGKNCTSMPPREGQCCPDTYICESDEVTTEEKTDFTTTSSSDAITTIAPPRRVNVEGSGYRNEDEEPYTEVPTFEPETEGSGEESFKPIDGSDMLIPEKETPSPIATTGHDELIDQPIPETTKLPEITEQATTEPDKGENTVPSGGLDEETSETPVRDNITPEKEELATTSAPATESYYSEKTTAGAEEEPISEDKITTKADISATTTAPISETTISDYQSPTATDKEEHPEKEPSEITEAAPTKADQMTEIESTATKGVEELSTKASDVSGSDIVTTESTAASVEQAAKTTAAQPEEENEVLLKEQTTESSVQPTKAVDIVTETEKAEVFTEAPTSSDIGTTSVNPVENEIDEEPVPTLPPSRIPGEGDCLLDGITYSNESVVPSTNNCHSSCKCVSSIVKCDPIICSAPPDYMDNCQPMYDSPDSCCPTYVCDHTKETVPPQSHSQMSGTESPAPTPSIECEGDQCEVIKNKDESAKPSEPCTSESCSIDTSKKPSECTTKECQEAEDKTGSAPHPEEPHPSEPHPSEPHPSEPHPSEPHTSEPQPSVPTEDCSGDKCTSAAQEPCAGDDCKIPIKTDEKCDSEHGCAAPAEQPCQGGDCKTQDTIPAKDDTVPCDGPDGCKTPERTSDCNDESCKTEPSTADSDNKEKCDGGDCTKPAQAPETYECNEEGCVQKPVSDLGKPFTNECTDPECKSQDNIPQVTETPVPDFEKVSQVTEQTIAHDTERGESMTDVTKAPEQEQPSKVTNIEETESTTQYNEKDQHKDEESMTSAPLAPELETHTTEAEQYDTHTDRTIVKETTISTLEDLPTKDSDATSIPIEDVTTQAPKLSHTEDHTTELPESTADDKVYETVTPSVTNELDKHDVTTTPSSVVQFSDASTEAVTESQYAETSAPSHKDEDQPSMTTLASQFEPEQDEKHTEAPVKETPVEETKEPSRVPEPTQTDITTEGQRVVSVDQEAPVTPKYESETESAPVQTPSEEKLDSDIPVTTLAPLEEDQKETDLPVVILPSAEPTSKPDDHVSVSEETMSPTVTDNSESTTLKPEILIKDDTSSKAPELYTEQPESHVTEPQDITTQQSGVQETEDQTSVLPTERIIPSDMETETPMSIIKDHDVTQTSPTVNLDQEQSTEKIDSSMPQSTEQQLTEFAQTTSKPEIEKDIKKKPDEEEPIKKPEFEIETTSPISIDGVSTEPIPIQESEKPEKQPAITEASTDKAPVSVSIDDETSSSGHEELPITEPTILETDAPHEMPSEIPDTKTPESFTQIPTQAETEAVDIVTPTKDIQDNKNYKVTDIPELTIHEHTDEHTTIDSGDIVTEKATSAPELAMTPQEIIPEKEVTKAPESTTISISEIPDEEPVASTSEHPLTEISEPKPQEGTSGISEQATTESQPLRTGAPESPNAQTNIPEKQGEPTAATMFDDVTSAPKLPVTEAPDSQVTQVADVTTTHKDKATEAPLSEDVSPTISEIPAKESTRAPPEDIVTPSQGSETEPQKESHEKPSDIPSATDASVTESEKDVTEEPVMQDSDIKPYETPAPELPQETTAVPESQDTETKAPEVLVTEAQDEITKIPEMQDAVTIGPEILATEPQKETTDVPAEQDVAHSVPEQPVTESQKESTEPPKEDAQVPQETSSDIPEIPVTETSDASKDQSPTTSIPEIPVTETQKGTEIPEPHDTEHDIPEAPTTESQKEESELEPHDVTKVIPQTLETDLPVEVTEPHKEITEVPELDSQPHFTEAPDLETLATSVPTTSDAKPEKEVTNAPEDQDLVTKAPETADVVTQLPESESIATNIPEISTSGMPKEVTEQSDAEITTQPSESVTKAPSHESKPTDRTQTETEESIVTEKDVTESPLKVTVKFDDHTEPESAEADVQTELPKVESSSPTPTEEVSHELTTKVPESLVTEPEEKTTEPPPTKIDEDKQEENIVTEAPISVTTKIAEPVEPEVQHPTEQPISQVPVEFVTESPHKDETKLDVTEKPEVQITEQVQPETETSEGTRKTEVTTPVFGQENVVTKSPVEPDQTSETKLEQPETTPYLVLLEEHTHKTEEVTTLSSDVPSDIEPTTPESSFEMVTEPAPVTETEKQSHEVDKPSDEEQNVEKETIVPEKVTEPTLVSEDITTSAPSPTLDINEGQETEKPLDVESNEISTSAPTPAVEQSETQKPLIPEPTSEADLDLPVATEKQPETTAPEDQFIFATTKATTIKLEEEITTSSPLLDKFGKPEDDTPQPAADEEKPKPDTPAHVPEPLAEEEKPKPDLEEIPKPVTNEVQPTEEAPQPDEDHFPPSGTGGYGQEPDYGEEDQAFGPGTCRYGGKVYVSAQQIPRDDPCDFCFCFRSDIICLQQSCPPPIHGCHEEPIQGFCCPRYECPVSMATSVNVTTTTTTTTTTLPPHFLPHAYPGMVQRRGCQIKGHTYKVGEVVRASSGPCLHCTCGGDGQMKCDPKVCTPEPMLRQMIAAAVSARRRR